MDIENEEFLLFLKFNVARLEEIRGKQNPGNKI